MGSVPQLIHARPVSSPSTCLSDPRLALTVPVQEVTTEAYAAAVPALSAAVASEQLRVVPPGTFLPYAERVAARTTFLIARLRSWLPEWLSTFQTGCR